MSLFKSFLATLMLVMFISSAQAGGPKLQDFPEIRWEEPQEIVVGKMCEMNITADAGHLDLSNQRVFSDLISDEITVIGELYRLDRYTKLSEDNLVDTIPLEFAVTQDIHVPDSGWDYMLIKILDFKDDILFEGKIHKDCDNEVHFNIFHSTKRNSAIVLNLENIENIDIFEQFKAEMFFANGYNETVYVTLWENQLYLETMGLNIDLVNLPTHIEFEDVFENKISLNLNLDPNTFGIKWETVSSATKTVEEKILNFSQQFSFSSHLSVFDEIQGTLKEQGCTIFKARGFDITLRIGEHEQDDDNYYPGEWDSFGESVQICTAGAEKDFFYDIQTVIVEEGNSFFIFVTPFDGKEEGEIQYENSPQEENIEDLLNGLLGKMVPPSRPIQSLPTM